jgi:sugar lactone lactonase YvrE
VSVVYYDNEAPRQDVWGKVDALAMDSCGYLWASAYDHDVGSLICYDPRYEPIPWESDPVKAHYRWFFDEPPLKTASISELSVDAAGRIYAYDASQNRLTVFRHGGKPLAGGIKVDTAYSWFGVVAAVRAAPDGGAYIAGAGGFMKISAGSLKVDTIDNTITNASDLAVQGNVLWFGTSNGLLRYDVDTREKVWTGESDGLLSGNLLSVAIDEKSGHLWIVSDRAVSRLDVGRAAKPAHREAGQVFPNVFSIGARVQGASAVTFARLAPHSTVSVYTVNGALVAKVISEYFTESEWRAAWTPKRTLAPGTYIAVIKPSGKKVKVLLKP